MGGGAQKLKTVCGDGLKLSDLDRLYRDAKKQTERAERASFHETEGYAEVDGKLIYSRQAARCVGKGRRRLVRTSD